MGDFYQIALDNRNDKDYQKWEKLNFILRRIFDLIGNVDGRVGPMQYLNDLTMDGHSIGDGPTGQDALGDGDFVTKSYFRSTEFGRMVVALLCSSGKTPLPIQGSVGTPLSGGGGVSDHALLTNLDYASAGHTGFVPAIRTIATTAPLTGGGDLSANRTFAIPQATALADGYLSSGDWTTFNNKVGGSGTVGKIPKFTGASTVGDSIVKEAAGKLGVDTVGAPAYKLEVAGQIKATDGSILPTVKNLVDAATIATDASLGNHFRVTLGGNRTLGNPTNPVDGQRIIWEITQDGTGSRTITLDVAFVVPSNVPPVVLSLGAGKTDMLGAIYNSGIAKWVVTGFIKEYS